MRGMLTPGIVNDISKAALIQDSYGKPPKMNVESRKFREAEEEWRNKFGKEGNKTKERVLQCGVTEKVTSSSNKKDRCPEECPFFVQDRNDEDFCTFSCVDAAHCARYHPKKHIGDLEFGVCRACIVDGCMHCDTSVLTDRCKECEAGYVLKPDGTCALWYMGTWVYVVGAILGVLVLLIVLWLVDMAIRPIWNPKGLEEGLISRSRMKIRNYDTEAAELYPLGTNLHQTCVAGPGMLMHFNFQLAVIVWAVFVALVWMALATFVDADLWRLGTRKYGTPRDNCILVAWGYETQQRLMWTKMLFLWIVYIGTMVMLIFYGIFQWRKHQSLDIEYKTIKDFALVLMGLPELPGTRSLEEDLKVAVAAWSGETVVGVSVAWRFKDKSDDIDELMFMNLKQRLAECDREPTDVDTTPPDMNAFRKFLWTTEQKVFGLVPEESESPAAKWDTPAIKGLLLGLKSSERAVVVFDTEEAKTRAFEKAAESGGFTIEDFHVDLEEIPVEPDTVQWANLGSVDTSEVVRKLILGFGIIALACLFWAVVFYSPYAYYVLTFNYSNGRQPGPIVGFAFSMIVVIGNAIMYEVCARISEWVGLSFRDQREVCYMMLYTIACMFNVLLDFVTTYTTAEIILESLGFRTYFGLHFRDVNSFTQKFETYGMQRSLAENTYSYAFPSTFLIPFLIEWMPTIALPYLVGKLIVKSHPEVRGLDAEGWLEMLPMDIGRYADLLLNIILGILIFYFPGGYTWSLFLGMAASHAYIYAFDYYKVLRQIPAVSYVEIDCEWWCQVLLAPIVGIMASCIVFKSNCQPGYHCYRGPPIIIACTAAWFVHCIFHVCFLKYILPMCGLRSKDNSKLAGITYKQCSTFLPATWFNTNPVHCLRSKYIYDHNPPCDFYRCGKEDLMRANPSIGCYLSHNAETLVSHRSDCTGRGDAHAAPKGVP